MPNSTTCCCALWLCFFFALPRFTIHLNVDLTTIGRLLDTCGLSVRVRCARTRTSEEKLMTITPGAINDCRFTCMPFESNNNHCSVCLISAIFMRMGSLNTWYIVWVLFWIQYRLGTPYSIKPNGDDAPNLWQASSVQCVWYIYMHGHIDHTAFNGDENKMTMKRSLVLFFFFCFFIQFGRTRNKITNNNNNKNSKLNCVVAHHSFRKSW